MVEWSRHPFLVLTARRTKNLWFRFETVGKRADDGKHFFAKVTIKETSALGPQRLTWEAADWILNAVIFITVVQVGISERRERERQAIRAKILNAARQLFVAEGYEAVTMRRIADAIEYSPTAIYLHFKDKETLIRELCKEDSISLAKAFHLIARERDPIARLRQIGLAYVQFGMAHPNHYRLMFMASHRLDPDDLAEMGHGNPEQDGYAFLVGTMRTAIEQGRLRPECRDPHLMAQVFWASVHGVVALHLTKAGDPWVEWRPLQETAAQVIEAMLRGFALAAGNR